MLATILGLVGAVVAALIAAWATVRGRKPRRSSLELVDVSMPRRDLAKPAADDPPVLDVKVRNTGGQPAVIKRMVVRFHQAVRLPYAEMPPPYDAGPGYVGAELPASGTYDVTLPDPGQAEGASVSVDLSQVVDAGEADRFLVRLARPHLHVDAAYLLDFDALYDAKDRRVRSRPVAVVFPHQVDVISAEDIKAEILRFRESVDAMRAAVDHELRLRGAPTPDWTTAPTRDDLPAALLSLDGNGDIFASGEDEGVYIANEDFWAPQRAVTRFLDDIEERYRTLVGICASAEVVQPLLRDALPKVKATLTHLPALRAEPQTHEPTPRAKPTPKALEERAFRLVQKQDWAGARAAFADLVTAQLAEFGPDHPTTLTSRHFLAKTTGEAGDPAAAATAFADLTPAMASALNPDHTSTLDCRSELARWTAMSGDPSAAAAAFQALVNDRTRVQGLDHPRTEHARANLARCLEKAGEVREATTVLTGLLVDQIRVHGPDSSAVEATRQALARLVGSDDSGGGENSAASGG